MVDNEDRVGVKEVADEGEEAGGDLKGNEKHEEDELDWRVVFVEV